MKLKLQTPSQLSSNVEVKILVEFTQYNHVWFVSNTWSRYPKWFRVKHQSSRHRCSATDEAALSFRCFYENQLLKSLFEASHRFLKREQLELPMGLIARMVLGEPAFVDQFAATVDHQIVSCFRSLFSISNLCALSHKVFRRKLRTLRKMLSDSRLLSF